MPPKKDKKENKEPKVKLTKAERKALAQQRKIDAAVRARFEELEKELELAKENERKVKLYLDKEVRRSTLPAVKREVKVLSHAFTRVMEAKNKVIWEYRQRLIEAEEEQKDLFYQQYHRIEELLNQFNSHLARDYSLFRKYQGFIIRKVQARQQQSIQHHQEMCNFYMDRFRQMKRKHHENLRQLSDEYFIEYHLRRTAFKDAFLETVTDLEETIKSLWREYITFYNKYYKRHEGLWKKYKEVKNKSEKLAAEIKMNFSRISYLERYVYEEEQEDTPDIEEGKKAMIAERDKFKTSLTLLKNQSREHRDMDEQATIFLSVASQRLMQEFEESYTKAEIILKLWDQCQLLQTLEDKIILRKPSDIVTDLTFISESYGEEKRPLELVYKKTRMVESQTNKLHEVLKNLTETNLSLQDEVRDALNSLETAQIMQRRNEINVNLDKLNI